MLRAVDLFFGIVLAAAGMQPGCAAAADPHSGILQLPTTNASALEQPEPTNVLSANTTLTQGQQLFSLDRSVFLVVQSDGNVVLYNALAHALYGNGAAATIWATNTGGSPNGPFSLAMQPDCNLVLYNSMGNPPQTAQYARFASGTYNKGMAPCRLVVTGDGGGGFAVVDSLNSTLYAGGSYSPSGTPHGVVPAGVQNAQGTRIYSADATCFLTAQSDGNLVLYSTARYNASGPVAAAAIWATDSLNSNGPFTLMMQQDCNLVLYNKNGMLPPDAIFATGTYNKGMQPCKLTVSSAGGGFIAVSDSHSAQLFTAPSPFQVLLMGGFAYPPFVALSQVYSTGSGQVTDVASTNPLADINSLALLPTIRAALAVGTDNTSSDTACALYDTRTGAWSPTGALNTGRFDFDLTVLLDGTALVSGGVYAATSSDSQEAIGSAELYSPVTGTWSYTGSLTLPRANAVSTLLQSGQVLIAGGQQLDGPQYIPGTTTAELYSPQSQSWAQVGSMATARGAYHQLLTLPGGQALVVGGQTGGLLFNSCELFSPATLSWSATGAMATARYLHRAVLLPSGNVLVSGGQGYAPPPPPCNNTPSMPMLCGPLYVPLNTTEIYSPATGTWSAAAQMPYERYAHSMVTLPSGLVLVTGGFGMPPSSNVTMSLASSLLYDETSNTWTETGSLQLPDSDFFIGSTAVLFHA